MVTLCTLSYARCSGALVPLVPLVLPVPPVLPVPLALVAEAVPESVPRWR